jgi:hypothetical protein
MTVSIARPNAITLLTVICAKNSLGHAYTAANPDAGCEDKACYTVVGGAAVPDEEGEEEVGC